MIKIKEKIVGLKKGEIFAFLGFYLLFAFFYYTILWLNRKGYDNPNDWFMKPKNFLDDAGLDYILKMIFTIPIWYLLFRKLKNWTISQRLLLHLFFLPLFVLGWQYVYYLISEQVGFYHLQGAGQVWDIYIPALFYILQFGIFHSYNYYRENQVKLILEGELRNAALKSELSAIKAQLNPHFLYNVFNTISASVPAENEKTRHLIAELADLFRYQLKTSKNELVPLQDEVEFVRKYLDLEKERFQERLEYHISVEDQILHEMVPSMLIQPLIENAIKHGITPQINGGTVLLNINKKGDKIMFEIKDNGVGVKDKTKLIDQGVGLTNTKLRLEKLYNTILTIEDNTPSGLKISFEL